MRLLKRKKNEEENVNVQSSLLTLHILKVKDCLKLNLFSLIYGSCLRLNPSLLLYVVSSFFNKESIKYCRSKAQFSDLGCMTRS
jgi:hypothetical protein